MERLKKYCNLPANSILESVIALCIIAVCLYVAVMVYAQVFTSKTSPRFYNTKNKMVEIYYLYQVSPDSILSADNDNLTIKQEWENNHLQELSIEYRDSSGVKLNNTYYIQKNE
ncbi:hypothetical protein [Flavobacterium sp. UBA7682]|uniref:hypothetical protein n=1 Tax=Flavobacterium sp. UBA7682 TaxID=1946560 RepID=UPI0025C66FCB|nr:hypothetical protein [Flavobacterium sp. UBA7682]